MGRGNIIRLSLDRGDLWDERCLTCSHAGLDLRQDA